MTGAVAVAVAVLFQTSPVVLGRALDAQTGEPAARGAVVVDGGTAGGARSEAASAVATGQAPRRVDALITANGDASVGRRVDVAGGSVDLGAIRLNRESAVVYGRVGVRRAPVPDALAARTPAIRIFGAYSANADWAAVPFLFVVNQPVSPFLSVGGGRYGFEASIERGLRGHLGLKASVSRYADPFRGTVAYCQPPFICAVGVPFRGDTSALYVTAGPVVTARAHKRTSLFAHALAGAVRSRSTFSFSGDNVDYVVDPTSLPTWLIVVTSQPFGQPNSVSYGDHLSDVGLAAALGGGIDRTLAHRLQLRVSGDWNPTFLSRPKHTTNAALATVPSERGMQPHVRLSLGVVWQLRR